jgi:hypothetical protein
VIAAVSIPRKEEYHRSTTTASNTDEKPESHNAAAESNKTGKAAAAEINKTGADDDKAEITLPGRDDDESFDDKGA